MHIEKYKNASVGAIVGHIKREHLHYKNESVDLSLTDNNTVFVNRDFKYYEDRIGELYVYGGWKDKTKLKYNSLVDIVVHCPKDYEDQERFFKIMNFVLCKKFGEDNVICSVVHRDEDSNGVISAHLHFAFIPTIWNDKKEKFQLSYEKCLAHGFNGFHDDIEKMIKEYFPKDNIKLHDDENKDKFYFDNIEDYKKMKLELERLQHEIDIRQHKIDELNIKGRAMVEKYNSLVDKFDDLKIQFDEMEKEIRRYLNDDMNLDEKLDFNRKYNIDEVVR